MYTVFWLYRFSYCHKVGYAVGVHNISNFSDYLNVISQGLGVNAKLQRA